MAIRVKKAATDQTFYFMLVDSAAGTPESDYTISNLDITYVRDRAAAVKTDATALSSITVAHADNKAIQVSKSTALGLYRVDYPDAAFSDSATVDRVQLLVMGTGLAPAVLEVELVKYGVSDLYEAVSDVKSELTKVYSDTTIIYSDTTHIDSDLTAISDTISDLVVKIDSDAVLTTAAVSDVRSSIVVLAAVVSDVQSDTNYMVPILSDVQSDTAVLVTMAAKYTSDVTKTPLSNLATAVAASDIKSELTKTYSDTTALVTKVDSDALLVQSDLSDVRSALTAITAIVSDVQSDTNYMVPIVSDVQSDTNVLVVAAAKYTSDVTKTPLSDLATPTNIGAITGDTGITLEKALEMLAAFMAGQVSASSAGGVTTYTYLKRNGSTTSFTAKCYETDGHREETGALL